MSRVVIVDRIESTEPRYRTELPVIRAAFLIHRLIPSARAGPCVAVLPFGIMAILLGVTDDDNGLGLLGNLVSVSCFFILITGIIAILMALSARVLGPRFSQFGRRYG